MPEAIIRPKEKCLFCRQYRQYKVREGSPHVVSQRNTGKSCGKKAYTLWYQIDEGSYRSNIEEALYYFGDCGKVMLKDYNDDRVGYNLKEKNLILTIVINDIKIDMASHKGYIEGVQTIRRDEGKVRRNIYAGFTFTDISPSDMNPFGVKIENWEIFNKEILNQ